MKLMRIRVDATTYLQAADFILAAALRREDCIVFAANVHMLMKAHDSPDFKAVVNSADLVTPDGMPLVWMMRLKGLKNQQRVYGPTLMLHVLETAAREAVSVGFYGSSPEVLQMLVQQVQTKFPNLKVVYSKSPPFRDLNVDEDLEITEDINASGVRILFVGLGCPKQEKWMAAHRGKIDAVMLGVGAAFDFHAGVKSQAPAWMQVAGLEWLFRLFTEPQRLWRRYIYNNPRFILLAGFDLLKYWFKV